MKIISDYHMHTSLCKHADGVPVDYLKVANERGLKVIGFSEHCPSPRGFDEQFRMNPEEYPEYKQLVRSVGENEYGIEVLFGLEIDWVPGKMDEVSEFIKIADLDYTIGSVHYLNGTPIDNPDQMEIWNSEEAVESIWIEYFKSFIEFLKWGQFDIIGHIDLPKKFGYRPTNMDSVYKLVNGAFDIAKEKNMILEISTAGLRKRVSEIYPSEEILKIAKSFDLPVTVSSDAHNPNDVGREFAKAEKLLLDVGYKEYIMLKKNRVFENISLV